jgi:hypothetical protein
MPPRRSARVAAAAEGRAAAALPALPPALARRVFLLLPVDVRARAALVCRAWRAALSERALWVRLDLSNSSGVRRLVTDAFFRAAVRMAHGELQSLSLAGYTEVSYHALRPVLLANAGTLRELVLRGWGEDTHGRAGTHARALELLLHAAPQLTTLQLDDVRFDEHCTLESARAALRREAPFGALRARTFVCNRFFHDAADVPVFAADLPSHAPTLTQLWLHSAPLAGEAAVSAVVDGVLAARLTTLKLVECTPSACAAPHLARLLLAGGASALTELHVDEYRNGYFYLGEAEDVPAALRCAGGAAHLARALRENATLAALRFVGLGLWAPGHDAAEVDAGGAGVALLGALTGHVSVHTLDVSCNRVPESRVPENRAATVTAAGAALGALLAANAPALTELDVSSSNLGEDGLRPLFEALPRNTHLRALRWRNNATSDAFELHTALPAARACTAMESLDSGVRRTIVLTRDAAGRVLSESRV